MSSLVEDLLDPGAYPDPKPASVALKETHISQVFLTDRVSWIHQMFDRAMAQRAAYARAREPVDRMRTALANLDALDEVQIEKHREALRAQLVKLAEQGELNAPVHADVLVLKSLHARCQRALDERRREA